MTVEPASSIEKLGFKRWYERQLIESHAWLVSCILCALAIAATLEITGFRLTSFAGFLAFGFVYLAGVVGWHSLRRYRALMVQAERLSEQSTCRACKTYAAFNVIAAQPRIAVRCRKCANEWTLLQ
jgi:hypothetical protein